MRTVGGRSLKTGSPFLQEGEASQRSRFEMGLSRKELAEVLKVDKGTILSWERGKKMFKYKEENILSRLQRYIKH